MTADTTARLRRVLIAELDSVVQHRLQRELGTATAEQHLVGVLRAAHLLAGTVLVTDAMLLDSRFFGSVGPAELAARLGMEPNRLPLSIVSRDGSLRSALEAKLADPGFDWQLGEHRPMRTWHAWIAAEEAGYVARETFTAFERDGARLTKPAFSVSPRLRTRSDHPGIAGFIERAGAAGGQRSLVYAEHAALRSTLPPEHQLELDRLLRQWNLHYLGAMAVQHHASWITFDPGLTAAMTSAEGLAGGLTGGLTDGLADGLAEHDALTISGRLQRLIIEAPPAVYAQMQFAAREASERFKAAPTARNLRSVAFALDAATSTPGLTASAFGAIASLVLALLGVGFGVLQGVGPDLSKWWTTAVVVLAGLVTFPWAAVPIFLATRSKHVAGLLAVGAAS